ncbi:MAG: type II toxin-antitoxin system RelE/ParE family toxin [Candidatus Woesearchaeota archaeon]|nr:type II toxin-antitoxin system RelE/ParE family toxin [Candidatus Woesearchaeota archaeon]
MIVFDKEATHFLEKLPKEISKRIFNKIMSTEANPYHFFERLEDRKEYKLRVGDYRVIADIENGTILVRFIGHRKNVYE